MSFDTLPLTMKNEIDQICDTFEDTWRGAKANSIESSLQLTSFPVRGELFRELLVLELELRTRSGEQPAPGDYLTRFPSYSELILTELASPTEIVQTALPGPTAGELRYKVVPHTDPARTALVTTVTHEPDRVLGSDQGGSAPLLPERIGRYLIRHLLGQGNFLVYLAFDPEQGRQVAIKVARPGDPRAWQRMMSLATEALRLDALEHQSIVKLYEYVPSSSQDFLPDGDGYLVLEYVEGQTLEQVFKLSPLSPGRLAEILAQVADAIHHAHISGVYHRDLKPSNILIDTQGYPRVCDFGLAIDEESEADRLPQIAGTLPYMAPEQVRGEIHRIDGRTDIWALGVIMYQGLVHRLPFPGKNQEEYFQEILQRDPKPPRMVDGGVPRELERICLRCLSRPMSDRYLTAADLAHDLRGWESVVVGTPPPVVVFKGLSTYDVDDASFFLGLLPGPRGSDRLPESIRFWKSRIEARNVERTFSVGLLYGPSGGGKSSFVKAGLLPCLDESRVHAIYLEATPSGTETRLLAELHDWAPGLRSEIDLPGAISLLRDAPKVRRAAKLLLVLDQFEQWLQTHPQDPDAMLIRALRHCDGMSVQVLLLVRDDYWMPATRFFRAVEVSLAERVNSAAVELFDSCHARKILEDFGRSPGRNASNDGVAGGERDRFLDEAVKDLTGPDGRIIPVRLSLFAEVVRHRPWTLATLAELGGMEGIGVKFLEQSFDTDTASPGCKEHRPGAEAVLHALLPHGNAMIRGTPRPARLLREASGYGDRPSRFNELMVLLERELRLVTATDPEGYRSAKLGNDPIPGEAPGETYYQLAHDYLIGPVRRWIENKQIATSKGRARIRLRQITASWQKQPSRHRLPSFLEWMGIRTRVERSQWTAEEHRIMQAATWLYLGRLAATTVLATLLILIAGKLLIDQNDARTRLNVALAADDRDLLARIDQLVPHQHRVIAELQAREGAPWLQEHDREVIEILLYRFAPTAERGR